MKYLGTKEEFDELDTFEGVAVDYVCFSGDELTAHCPVTNQPDFYEFKIEYTPYELCIESKSLKLYIMSFRDRQAFAEQLCLEIAEYIDKQIKPLWVKVTLTQQVRGGIQLQAVKEISYS